MKSIKSNVLGLLNCNVEVKSSVESVRLHSFNGSKKKVKISTFKLRKKRKTGTFISYTTLPLKVHFISLSLCLK